VKQTSCYATFIVLGCLKRTHLGYQNDGTVHCGDKNELFMNFVIPPMIL